MKNTWLRLTALCLLALNGGIRAQECNFPESEVEPFFFDVDSGLARHSIIVDTAVDPPDARLSIVNVRSNNLQAIDFTSKFFIDKRATGQFMVVNREMLALPEYPSPMNETFLYMTVMCNERAYPLITIRVRNENSFSPKFYNEPYEVTIQSPAIINSMINTPIMAMDRDPHWTFGITYNIESGQFGDEFALVTSRTETYSTEDLPPVFSTQHALWRPEQLPRVVKLHIQRPLKAKEYNLNISATDSGNPPRTVYSNLRVVLEASKLQGYLKFSNSEYFANFSKLLAVDSEIVPNVPVHCSLTDLAPSNLKRSRVMYELVDSDLSEFFLLDPRTAQLTVRQEITDEVPSAFALTIKAFLEKDPSVETVATLSLVDISDASLVYFSKCNYDVSVTRDAYEGTTLLRLQIHGEPDDIVLRNGTEFFRVDHQGQVQNRKRLQGMDMYSFQVQLIDHKRKPSSALCSVATITVTVQSGNENPPRFDRPHYVFYTDEFPYNNTEIGTIRASDQDAGVYGQLHYRIVHDSSEKAPFMLYEVNGAATIYFISKASGEWPERSYTITVEAYDASDNPRTARVSVQINLSAQPDNVNYDVAESNAPHVLSGNGHQMSVESTEVIDAEPVHVQREEIRPTTKPVPVKKSKNNKTPKSIIRPLSQVNIGSSKEKFESSAYKFLLYGKLQQGQYVGTIRVSETPAHVQYELEKGILGFFKVDPVLGHITVDGRLLEDSYEEIRFAAVAKRNDLIVANTLITVILDDSVSIYELTPRFEQSLYRFEVEENTPPVIVGSVKAHHRAVEVSNDRVVYSIKPVLDADSFEIDPNTGEVSNKQEFDREKKHLYSVQIVGCLRSNSSSCGESEAAIVVIDVNDNAPVFQGTPYRVKISPDVGTNTQVATVKATDVDLGRNGEVKYELVSSGRGNFKIDESTGELSFIGGDDALKVNRRFNLKVKATDNGFPPLSSETVVVVNVGGQNPNPNAPEFTNFRYELTLPPRVPADFTIMTVGATDPDPGPEGVVTYKIPLKEDARSKRIHQLFELDAETGELRTKQQITSESDGPLLQFVIEAWDQSEEFPRKAESVVMLRFKEERMGKIEFVPLPKTVFISNEKPVGSEIISVMAKTLTDDDAHRIRYVIAQPNNTKQFEIDEVTGSLRVRSSLEQGRFPLTITAYIPRTPLTTVHNLMIVVMTDRDKYPVFEKLGYEMKVPTVAAFPVKLMPLNATISTGHIEYSLYNADHLPRGISVDKMNGQLTVFEEFLSAFDGAGNVFVVIRARNVDWPNFYSDVGVTLVLSDTDTSLAFSAKLYRLMITENRQAGTTLEPPVEVQNAMDVGEVQYFVEPDSIFSINNRGELYLKRAIDLEELPQSSQGILEVTVVAVRGSDRATTKVQIKVEDENEFSPLFLEDQYDFEIREQPADGQVIGKVSAIDEDFNDRGHVKYEILERSGAASSIVAILPNGTLVKKPGETFVDGIAELIVQASDSVGHTAEVAVSFYVRLQEPSEPRVHNVAQTWEVDENVVGNRLAVHGLPNARWEFNIADGNDDGVFELRELNDTMAEVEIVALPNMTTTARRLEVQSVNMDNPRESVMTKIDVDLTRVAKQKLPRFEGTLEDKDVHLPPDFNPNAVVFRAKATQLNGSDPILYSLVKNPHNMFDIDERSGEVVFAHNNEPKLPARYEVRVKATAVSQRHFTQFSSEDSYSVQILPLTLTTASTTRSAPIARPLAEVTLPPVSGETNTGTSAESTQQSESFETTSFTSEQTETTQGTEAATSSVTTPEVTETSSSTVTETTSTTTQSTPAPVQSTTTPFLPVAFEQPAYSFMMENPRRGAKIGELFMTGHTVDSEFRIDVSPPALANIFRVDAETGEVFVVNTPSSSEELQEYVFNVTLVDNNNPRRRAQTEVTVTAVPFHVETEAVTVPTAESPVDQIEHNLSTPETFIDTSVAFTFEAPVSKPIQAVPTDAMPEVVEPEFNFATDYFKAILPEGRYGNGGKVIALKPFNLNHDMPSGVRYRFELSSVTNVSLPFTLREDTGDLIVFGEIDFEVTDVFEFVVVAEKKQEGRELVAQALVEVQILDVNDNPPEFVRPVHVVPIAKGLPVGSEVAQFAAIDQDTGAFGTLSFTLEGEFASFFAIDQEGRLTLAKALPEGTEDNISLAIVAADGGRPALRTVHVVRVELYAPSNDAPAFKQAEYHVVVVPDSQRGQFLEQIVAGTGNYSYHFKNSYSDLFVVDDSGTIYLGRNPIPKELNVYYSLELQANDDSGRSATANVTVFLEGSLTTTTIATTPKARPTTAKHLGGDADCQFLKKIYNVELMENSKERKRLVKVESECHNLPKDAQVVYFIHQGAQEFEMDESTGELYVNGPLDRENRTLHFVVVNITILTPDRPDSGTRKGRQASPIVEYARSKLAENQALVVVRVLDENDNVPKFTRTNLKGEYSFVIDVASQPQSIARVQATDADEKPNITYSFVTPTDIFALNATTGVITLTKSLVDMSENAFDLDVKASDGKNEATTKVHVFPLKSGSNLVIMTINSPVEDVKEALIGQELTRTLQMDTRVLGKHVLVDEQKNVHPDKTYLLLYALQKETHFPVEAEALKDQIVHALPELAHNTHFEVLGVSLPAVATQIQISTWEIVLVLICVVLLLTVCVTLFLLLRWCKQRSTLARSETEYMVDTESNGPRPYNVELISRRTAQTMLAGRELPNPFEEAKLSPQSRASMLTSSGALLPEPSHQDRGLLSVASPNQSQAEASPALSSPPLPTSKPPALPSP